MTKTEEKIIAGLKEIGATTSQDSFENYLARDPERADVVLKETQAAMEARQYLVIERAEADYESESAVEASIARGEDVKGIFSPSGLDEVYRYGEAMAMDSDMGYDAGAKYYLDVTDMSEKGRNALLLSTQNKLEGLMEDLSQQTARENMDYEDSRGGYSFEYSEEMDRFREEEREMYGRALDEDDDRKISVDAIVNTVIEDAIDSGAKPPITILNNAFTASVSRADEREQAAELTVTDKLSEDAKKEKETVQKEKTAVKEKQQEPVKQATAKEPSPKGKEVKNVSNAPKQAKGNEANWDKAIFFKPGIAKAVLDEDKSLRGFSVYGCGEEGAKVEIPKGSPDFTVKQLHNSARFKNWVVVEPKNPDAKFRCAYCDVVADEKGKRIVEYSRKVSLAELRQIAGEKNKEYDRKLREAAKGKDTGRQS